MTRPSIYLLMAIHSHQPVGNFGFVFEDAFRKAYEPFVKALERHPSVRVSLHYSGSLLAWFDEHRPDFMERLKRLVARQQIDIMASGFYEPILPIIPEPDRVGQITRMQDAVERWFGRRPNGLWLTERVWEPELPATLARCGIGYTMVDTNQFTTAQVGLPAHLQVRDERFWDVLGSYRTEYAGASVRLFPMSKRLRYWLPFKDTAWTIDFLRNQVRTEPTAVSYGDDGEKFGLWPKTYEWVYEQGWLERFFESLERESGWLKTATVRQYLERAPADGQVYVPCGSYEEMLEWSGGYFRNFFVKYPESGAMYRKMLRVSERVAAATSPAPARGRRAQSATPAAVASDGVPPLEQAREALYKAQCNDAYWHGVFGGLYLANLRGTVQRHLIEAERWLDAVDGAAARELVDVDGDEDKELRLRSDALSLVVDADGGGVLSEVDVRPRGVNLADVLARRYEPYHEKVKAKQLTAAGGQEPASIHDAVVIKEAGLEDRLIYDDHRRVWFHDYGLSGLPTLDSLVRGGWTERRVWAGGRWEFEQDARGTAGGALTARLTRRVDGGQLRKTIELDPHAGRIRFGYEIIDVAAPVVALEFNLCAHDPDRDTPRWDDNLSACEVRDDWAGLRIRWQADRPAAVVTMPVETVSESEDGLGRTPQGLSLMWVWPTQDARRWACSLECTIEG